MDINELSVWGISEAIARILEEGLDYDNETGDVYFTEDDLEALQESFDTKLNSLTGYVKQTESKIEGLKQRRKEIDENIKFNEKKADRIKNYIKTLMERNNMDKRELSDYRLGFRKSKAIEINDEINLYKFFEANPEYKEKCVKEEVKTSIVKTEIKDLINQGIEVPGAALIENKNLTIK